MRSRWRVAIVCLAVLLLVACGRLADSDTEVGFLSDFEVDVDGQPRQFDVYIPQGDWDEPPRALLVLLHANRSSKEDIGGGSFGASPYARFQPIADEENIALLLPQGSEGPEGHAGWNDCRADAEGNPVADDVGFLEAAIEQVVDRWSIAPNSTFAVGTSNGGHMAQRFAAERPELVRGIAVIAAGVPANSMCAASSDPVAALFMWGTEDPIAPFAGGQMAGGRGEILSAENSIARWLERNGLPGEAMVTEVADLDESDESTVRRESYGAAGSEPVEFYRIVGGGHTEPSIAEQYRQLFERVVGKQNHDIEMANEVWTFFDGVLTN